MTEPDVVVRDGGDGVAVVLLNRPEVLNAVTASLARNYAATLRRLDEDGSVRAIVVTGAGRGFCAGADLRLLGGGLDELRAAVPPRADLPSAGLAPTTPIVAAANGAVAGVGVAYLLGSDVRFADPDAKITTAFSQLGLVAEYGLSWLLPRLIGLASATELLLSGRVLTGAEAATVGLVHRVSQPGQVLDEAITYARGLARSCSSWSLAAIKGQLAADRDGDYDTALTRALALMESSFEREELHERLAARVQSKGDPQRST